MVLFGELEKDILSFFNLISTERSQEKSLLMWKNRWSN